MDIGKAFAFLGEDEDWIKKLGLGALFAMIPIVNFAVFGYHIQIARNVANDEERPLPTWDDFGAYLGDGLRLFAVMMVYMLPVICAYVAFFGFFFSYFEAFDPAYTGASGTVPPEPPAELFAAMGLMFACILPYTFFMYALFPMFAIQIARHKSVGSCFRFSEMWQLFRAQTGNYILMTIIMVGVYMAGSMIAMPISFVAILIPCIGYVIYLAIYGAIMTLTFSVTGHLEGQFMKGIEKPGDLDDYSDIVAFDG